MTHLPEMGGGFPSNLPERATDRQFYPMRWMVGPVAPREPESTEEANRLPLHAAIADEQQQGVARGIGPDDHEHTPSARLLTGSSTVTSGPQGEIAKDIAEPLTHGTLITSTSPLLPDYIPVHPRVYAAKFAFTSAFVEEVKGRVPEAMEQDRQAIREKLGTKARNVLADLQPVEYERIPLIVSVDPESRSLDITKGDTNFALDTEEEHLIELVDLRHPTHPLASLSQQMEHYARENADYPGTSDLITWYTHNLSGWAHEGLSLGFWGRNFAIVYNNLGLQWLREGKR